MPLLSDLLWSARPPAPLASARHAGAWFRESAGIPGVTAIKFLFFFAPRETHLRRIDDDDVIAHVNVRRVAGLVLAHQNVSGLRSHAPQHQVFRVDNVPVTRNILARGNYGFHVDRPS